MEPITWNIAAGLLIKYGFELTDFIVKRAQAGVAVNPSEWEELRKLAAKTPEYQFLDAVTRAGLSLDDAKVKAVLAMLPK